MALNFPKNPLVAEDPSGENPLVAEDPSGATDCTTHME